ncbi:MAG: hypothetical protein JEZ03_13790 [Bacteroidales bacterium]|nr:hypothetical protein [Bacteroidales bacterium]
MKNTEGSIGELLEKITRLIKENQELKDENIKFRNIQMGTNTDHEKTLNEKNQYKKENAELKINQLELQHQITEAEKKLIQAQAFNQKLEQAAKNLISENLKLKEEIHGMLPEED